VGGDDVGPAEREEERANPVVAPIAIIDRRAPRYRVERLA
jgi:hypothetical protein